MNIAKRIQDLLQNPKYSGKGQNEIAMEIGIAPSVLSRVKNGDSKDPSASTILAIAKYFNVSTDYILGLSDITSADVEIQDICKKLSCPDEMIPIIRNLFINFCPLSYVVNNTSDYDSISQIYSNLPKDYWEFRAERENIKNMESGEKINLRYMVLKAILKQTSLFDTLSEVVQACLTVKHLEDEKRKIYSELRSMSSRQSDEHEEIDNELYELEVTCQTQQEAADAREWQSVKLLSAIIKDISDAVSKQYYISDEYLYDRTSVKRISKCTSAFEAKWDEPFPGEDMEEYEEWRRKKNAEE